MITFLKITPKAAKRIWLQIRMETICNGTARNYHITSRFFKRLRDSR